MTPIGPKARNMNKVLSYQSGEMNQLLYWAALGWIDKNSIQTDLKLYRCQCVPR